MQPLLQLFWSCLFARLSVDMEFIYIDTICFWSADTMIGSIVTNNGRYYSIGRILIVPNVALYVIIMIHLFLKSLNISYDGIYVIPFVKYPKWMKEMPWLTN